MVHLCKLLQTTDYLTDSLNGNESVHVMSLAFIYQGGFALDPKNLMFPAQNISKVRRRALKSAETKLYELAFSELCASRSLDFSHKALSHLDFFQAKKVVKYRFVYFFL